jgi:hypothetical protein
MHSAQTENFSNIKGSIRCMPEEDISIREIQRTREEHAACEDQWRNAIRRRQTLWYTSTDLAIRMLSQEDTEFEASLGHIEGIK